MLSEREHIDIIQKPTDQEILELLGQKLEQYIDWKNKLIRKSQIVHPNSRDDFSNMQRSYTLRILSDVLEKGEVNVSDLEKKLHEEQGNAFDGEKFNFAYRTVKSFATDKDFLEYSIKSDAAKNN
jgi:hypothetical protein